MVNGSVYCLPGLRLAAVGAADRRGHRSHERRSAAAGIERLVLGPAGALLAVFGAVDLTLPLRLGRTPTGGRLACALCSWLADIDSHVVYPIRTRLRGRSFFPCRPGRAGAPTALWDTGRQMDPRRKRRIRLVVALSAAVLLAGALVYTSFSASS